MPQPPPTPTGLLLIDKAPGFTSMDVCAIIRTRLRRAGAPKRIKVGHGGTLDPMATGLLVVLVGKATPLCNAIMVGEKIYEAGMDFSATSTTEDAEGVLTPIANPPTRTREEVERAAAGFVGRIMQRPPQVSALRVGGRRAYEMAREGLDVPLEPRPVDVHEFTILSVDWPRAAARVRCGKGTYIRSLARDLGFALGAGGYLTSLRRTRIGRFGIEEARSLDALPQVLTQDDLLPIAPVA